ncbi:Solute carrier family 13 member 5 [Lamellibrachia satsuma]|nr:Solute carrier family 13 member 5 [Lamellibrachia satsuma]
MYQLKVLRVSWRTVVFVATPLLLLPIPLANSSSEAKAAYGVLVMAVYWMTESIPLPATALMPMFIFPMLGVMGAKDIAKNYLKDTNMLIMGGLMVAVSIECCNLHRRVALAVLRLVGVKKKWLMFGFMFPTWFLSMWISVTPVAYLRSRNTATTAMMFPVAQAVLAQFEQGRQSVDQVARLRRSLSRLDRLDRSGTGTGTETETTTISSSIGQFNRSFTPVQIGPYYDGLEMSVMPSSSTAGSSHSVLHIEPDEDENNNSGDSAEFGKCLSLAIAYAANIGGIATLTGTGPNLVFKNIIDDEYASKGLAESPITFMSWMIFGVPLSGVCLVIGWFWLQMLFIGCRCRLRGGGCQDEGNPEIEKAVRAVIREDYYDLGPFRFAEGFNVVLFLLLAFLWLLRDPRFIPGWGELFKEGYVTDASCALFVCVLLFAAPTMRPKAGREEPASSLLEWSDVVSKFPWGVIILIGGGFALADVCKVSGLSAAIGDRLQVLAHLPGWVLVMLVAAMVAALTEFTSNVATSSLLLPILAKLSQQMCKNPLYLMFPGVIAASFAFMLPVATPPNAIVFANGYLKVTDMAKAGVVMNIMCVIATTFVTETIGMAYFDLNTIPWPSNCTNSTM